MSKDLPPKPVKTPTPVRRPLVIYSALFLVIFLLGLGPMWLKSRECSQKLSAVERQMNLAGIQSALASATIDARRGDYEAARQAASTFFTSLQTETDSRNDSALSHAQREEVQSLFSRRDEIITLLARSDPASGDRLSDLYVTYRKIMSR